MTVRVRKIGILKPCCIGDAVMTFPAIDSILQSPSPPQIEVWTGRHTRPVYALHPGISSIVEIPSVPSPADLPSLAWRIGRSDNDGFIVLDPSRIVEAACRMARTEILGSVRRPLSVQHHEVDKYLDVILQASFQPNVGCPKLDLDPAAVRIALERADAPAGPFVTLHPGGAENPGAEMPSKRWPAPYWSALIKWLEGRDVGIILTGSADEVALCTDIARGSTAKVAAGQLTLRESAAVASQSLAFVGPDTGLAHLAAAAGASVIVIFGPTNPRQYAPRGSDVQVLAASGSKYVESTDLRRNLPASRPSTSTISVSDVVAALTPRLATARKTPC